MPLSEARKKSGSLFILGPPPPTPSHLAHSFPAQSMWRSSRLTYMLRDYFTAGQAIMVVTMSLASRNVDEMASVISYAAVANQVRRAARWEF